MKVHTKMKYIMINKEGLSLEEFKNAFYRKLRMNALAHNEGEFDNFLQALYTSKDNKEFTETIKKINYSFVRNESDLVVNFITSSTPEELELAFLMHSYQTTIIERICEYKSVLYAHDYRQRVLTKAHEILEGIKNNTDDNIINTTLREFEERFNKSANTISTRKVFDKLYNEIPVKIVNTINEEINGIEKVEKAAANYACTVCTFEDKETVIRSNYGYGYSSRKK